MPRLSSARKPINLLPCAISQVLWPGKQEDSQLLIKRNPIRRSGHNVNSASPLLPFPLKLCKLAFYLLEKVRIGEYSQVYNARCLHRCFVRKKQFFQRLFSRVLMKESEAKFGFRCKLMLAINNYSMIHDGFNPIPPSALKRGLSPSSHIPASGHVERTAPAQLRSKMEPLHYARATRTRSFSSPDSSPTPHASSSNRLGPRMTRTVAGAYRRSSAEQLKEQTSRVVGGGMEQPVVRCESGCLWHPRGSKPGRNLRNDFSSGEEMR